MNTKVKIGNDFVNGSTKTAKSKVVATVNVAQNPLLSGLIQENNLGLTENGALTYKSTLNSVLDLFSMGGALRQRQDNEVISLFTKAYGEDKLLALKALFNIRNIRGGAGERKSFRTVLKYLGNSQPTVVAKNLSNIAHFGRFDDLFVLFGTSSEKEMVQFVTQTLNQDIQNYYDDKAVSLLAKWLPSENASSKQTRELASKFRKAFGWDSKRYRKTLSTLRAYLDVIEVKMCEGNFGAIDYKSVPSKAGLNYRTAFHKRDGDRYKAYLDKVEKGEVKINAGALFPYEIVEKVQKSYGNVDRSLDALWNALPDYLDGSDRNILTVCDVSGSMTCAGGRPMQISVSLGIYTAERNKGPFNGYFITFSENPSLQKVTGSNITEKVNNLSRADWGGSTNVQGVFQLILNKAIQTNCPQNQMPAQVLIISDMEFNYCGQNTNLDAIRKKYQAAGYQIPQLVFWNVNSRNNNVPAQADEKGVLLVSGASPSVFKTLLGGKQYTPVDQMLATLTAPQYDRVTI